MPSRSAVVPFSAGSLFLGLPFGDAKKGGMPHMHARATEHACATPEHHRTATVPQKLGTAWAETPPAGLPTQPQFAKGESCQCSRYHLLCPHGWHHHARFIVQGENKLLLPELCAAELCTKTFPHRICTLGPAALNTHRS